MAKWIWIEFVLRVNSVLPPRKTLQWEVRPVADAGNPLGEVRWYGRWRKYCFFAEPSTIYEQDCLRDIAQFCEEKTKEFRAEKRSAKETSRLSG
jgi:hypothetical protein